MMTIREISRAMGDVVRDAGAMVAEMDIRDSTRSAMVVGDKLISAAHELGGESAVPFRWSGGSGMARLIGRDRRFDVAVFDTGDPIPDEGKAGETPRPGEIVLPVARSGDTVRTVWGLVTRVESRRRLPGGAVVEPWIETDGTLPAGFAGGPLIDAEGGVLGMNTPHPRGVGMTVPMEFLRLIVARILESGDTGPAYLGINSVSVPLEGEGEGRGLMITEVDPGSPAGNAGLRQGDILESLGGEAMTDMNALLGVLSTGPREVEAGCLRSGEHNVAAVLLRERRVSDS